MTSALNLSGRALGRTLLNSELFCSAEILALDLREVLVEGLADAGRGGLAVMRVVQELAFLLGLGDVGGGLEAVHRGDLALLGGSLADRRRNQRQGGNGEAGLESLTSRRGVGVGFRGLFLHVRLLP